MARFFGYNPPFISGARGILPRQEDEQIVKNDILQLLFTLPGERVHRPTFGTILRTSLFEPMDESTIDNLRTSITEAIEREEPRLFEPQVVLTPYPDKNLLEIVISGELNFKDGVQLTLIENVRIPGIVGS